MTVECVAFGSVPLFRLSMKSFRLARELQYLFKYKKFSSPLEEIQFVNDFVILLTQSDQL